jgi:hypothetical protein
MWTMLKSLQAILLVSCLATAASAGPVTLSVRAGSSIPDLRDNGGNEFSSGWSTRVGLFLGVAGEVQVAPAFSVEADVNYSQQGAKKNGLQAASVPDVPLTLYANFKNTAKLDYVEIPVLAKYHFGLAKRFFVGAGPYAGLLLSAKNVTSGVSAVYLDKNGTPFTVPPGDPEGVPLVADFGATTDNKDALHSFNWGIQASVGAVRPAGRGQLSLEVRGELGLMNIQKHPDVDGKNSTGALVIALGYGMRFGE